MTSRVRVSPLTGLFHFFLSMLRFNTESTAQTMCYSYSLALFRQYLLLQLTVTYVHIQMKGSPKETICMKCLNLFAEKSKKNFIDLLPAKLTQRIKVKLLTTLVLTFDQLTLCMLGNFCMLFCHLWTLFY